MYILTRSGRRFSFTAPAPTAVDIQDIAHALCHINRFTGHAAFPYSVARHSIAVADYLRATGAPPEIVYAGLLHDAHEAYFGDINTPLKQALGLREQEARVQAVVAEGLGVPLALLHDPRVKQADLVALAVEREVLMPDDGPWACLDAITDEMCAAMPKPKRLAWFVREGFLRRYHRLRGEVWPAFASLAHETPQP